MNIWVKHNEQQLMYKRHNKKILKNNITIFFATLFFIGGPLYVANWQIQSSKQTSSPISMVKNIQLHEGDHALKILAYHGFDMASIRANKAKVPEVYFANLPHELTKIKNTRLKKNLFFSILLPPILKVNDIIRHDRKRLKKIILGITLGNDISERDYYWLTKKLVQYKVKVIDIQDFVHRTGDILETLLNRVNIIPPELALAQAAQESGWGTSRFAQKGNALYGEWTWENGCGMVPTRREKGKTHRMKCFKSVIEAIDSYMLNLNTHKAYTALRHERRAFRDDQVIDVMPLVETLVNYSEEGQAYVEKIKNIIRINKLKDFSQSQLKTSG